MQRYMPDGCNKTHTFDIQENNYVIHPNKSRFMTIFDKLSSYKLYAKCNAYLLPNAPVTLQLAMLCDAVAM